MTDFIGQERPGEIIDWNRDEMHRQAWDEMTQLCGWWKDERPGRRDPLDDVQPPPEDEYRCRVMQMLQIQLSNRLADALNLLEPGVAPKQQVERLAEQELRRRLARYQLSDRLFREKYGMTLEEFEATEMVKTHRYSF